MADAQIECPDRYRRSLTALLAPATLFHGFDLTLIAVLLPQIAGTFAAGEATLGLTRIPIELGLFAAFFVARLADRLRVSGRRPGRRARPAVPVRGLGDDRGRGAARVRAGRDLARLAGLLPGRSADVAPAAGAAPPAARDGPVPRGPATPTHPPRRVASRRPPAARRRRGAPAAVDPARRRDRMVGLPRRARNAGSARRRWRCTCSPGTASVVWVIPHVPG